jgi:hypothetical protein
LLRVWTGEERAAARAQLAQYRDEIDRLDVAIAAFEPAVEDRDSVGWVRRRRLQAEMVLPARRESDVLPPTITLQSSSGVAA